MAQNMERTMAGKDGAKKTGGTAGEGDEAAAAGGKKKKILIAAVAAVVLLGGGAGGGYVLLKPDTAAAETEHVEEVLVPGDVTALDAVTINLADGRYLKLGIALQQVYAEAGGHGGTTALDGSKALDLAIGEFSGVSMTDLSNAESRQHYKDELQEKIIEAYVSEPAEGETEGHKQVMGIYLTQFVMQ